MRARAEPFTTKLSGGQDVVAEHAELAVISRGGQAQIVAITRVAALEGDPRQPRVARRLDARGCGLAVERGRGDFQVVGEGEVDQRLQGVVAVCQGHSGRNGIHRSLPRAFGTACARADIHANSIKPIKTLVRRTPCE